MRKKKLYLETSIINFVYADDSPDKKEVTIEMFNLLEKEEDSYSLYISRLILEEIGNAEGEKTRQLLEVIANRNFTILEMTEEAQKLGERYIKEGLIPRKYDDDAYHIAIATVHDMDVIVSWNFKHIVKMKTIEGVKWINESEGYRPIEIYSPWEVLGSD